MHNHKSSASIPLDLMIKIFTRLPAKSLMKFKCLSKQYSSIIQSPYFVDLFLSYSSKRPRVLFSFMREQELVLHSATTHTDEPSLSVTSTIAPHVMTIPAGERLEFTTPPVRSLICYSIRPNQHVICNPFTRQLLHLPLIEIWKEKIFHDEYLLFGYEPISKRFKVICIMYSRHFEQQFWIFTVGDGNYSWRKIQDKPCPYQPDSGYLFGICINGVLYYKVRTKSRYGDDTITRQVVSFDLNSEKFTLIKVPHHALEIWRLIDYKGKLAFIDCLDEEIRIWVLENEEKHEWSSEMYNMDELLEWSGLDESSATGVCEGEIVFVPVPPISDPLVTWHFDLEKKTTRRVKIKLPPNNYGYLDYVSLNYIDNIGTL